MVCLRSRRDEKALKDIDARTALVVDVSRGHDHPPRASSTTFDAPDSGATPAAVELCSFAGILVWADNPAWYARLHNARWLRRRASS
jgi:hypothetical protein